MAGRSLRQKASDGDIAPTARLMAPAASAFVDTYPGFLVQSEFDERFALLAPVEGWHEAEPRTLNEHWLRFMLPMAS